MSKQYRASAKLFIGCSEGEGESTFGSGLISLLRGVDESGSLNRAAKDMHMAYSKAWKLMNSAEERLGIKLIERDGARGSTLTPEATRLIAAFDTVNSELSAYADKRMQEEMAKLGA